ncbi:MAG: cytochrome c oxidase subunit II [Myxococcota bacterium]
MIEPWVVQASTYAADIDGIIWLVAVLVGFWFLVAEGVLLWLVVRYRAKPGVRADYITGEEAKQKRWVAWPHYLVLVCDVFILVGAIRVWVEVKQQLPPEPEAQHIRVISQQWAWSFVHPGPDGKLDSADDIKTVDDLHVQVGQTYIYELESRDVLHSFSVPVFRLKQDAVPGRVITGWFEATRTGTHDIQCVEICGIGHGVMAGRIVIESPEQHAAWMAKHDPTQLAAHAR